MCWLPNSGTSLELCRSALQRSSCCCLPASFCRCGKIVTTSRTRHGSLPKLAPALCVEAIARWDLLCGSTSRIALTTPTGCASSRRRPSVGLGLTQKAVQALDPRKLKEWQQIVARGGLPTPLGVFPGFPSFFGSLGFLGNNIHNVI